MCVERVRRAHGHCAHRRQRGQRWQGASQEAALVAWVARLERRDDAHPSSRRILSAPIAYVQQGAILIQAMLLGCCSSDQQIRKRPLAWCGCAAIGTQRVHDLRVCHCGEPASATHSRWSWLCRCKTTVRVPVSLRRPGVTGELHCTLTACPYSGRASRQQGVQAPSVRCKWASGRAVVASVLYASE